MRKLLFFLCTLLTGVGTMWADGPDVTGKSFTLTCERGSVIGNGTRLNGSSEATPTKFAIVEYEGSTYLYDTDNKVFVINEEVTNVNGNNNNLKESATDFSKIMKGVQWKEAVTSGTWHLLDENGHYLNMSGTAVRMNTWKSADGGNQYTVTADENFDDAEAITMLEEYYNTYATVTYVISDGVSVVSQDKAAAKINSTITVADIPESCKRDFCTYTVPEKVIDKGEHVINVTVSYNMPFEVSTSFDDAKWYTMNLRGADNKKDVSMGENEPYSLGVATESAKRTDAYHWAFMGNPYAGVKIYNRKAGGDNTLTKDGENVVMRPGNYSWDISSRKDGFLLKEQNTASNYINDNGGLRFWNTTWAADDEGSTFRVEEVEEMIEVVYNIYKDEKLFASVVGRHFAGEDAILPETYINNDYVTYTYSTSTIDKNTKEVRVDVTWEGLPFELSTDYEHATWYYMSAHTGLNPGQLSTDGDAIVYSKGNSGITTPYMWAFLGNPVEGIKIINKASGADKQLQPTDPATMGANGKAWSLRKQTNGSMVNGKTNPFGFYDFARNQYLNANASNKTLKYYGSFDQGSTFWVDDAEIDVTLSIDGTAHYSTFIAPFDVEIPDGVTAYEASGASDETLQMTEISNTIPANTPVVLYSEDGISTTVSGISTAEKNTYTDNAGLLTGVYTDTTAEADWYVLQNHDGEVAFYQVQDVQPMVTAYHAYLTAGDNSVKAFHFGSNDATAIKSVENAKEGHNAIYDLTGRRVENAVKGIYIVNGKKVVLK